MCAPSKRSATGAGATPPCPRSTRPTACCWISPAARISSAARRRSAAGSRTGSHPSASRCAPASPTAGSPPAPGPASAGAGCFRPAGAMRPCAPCRRPPSASTRRRQRPCSASVSAAWASSPTCRGRACCAASDPTSPDGSTPSSATRRSPSGRSPSLPPSPSVSTSPSPSAGARMSRPHSTACSPISNGSSNAPERPHAVSSSACCASTAGPRPSLSPSARRCGGRGISRGCSVCASTASMPASASRRRSSMRSKRLPCPPASRGSCAATVTTR
jgi:hypothetical protein